MIWDHKIKYFSKWYSIAKLKGPHWPTSQPEEPHRPSEWCHPQVVIEMYRLMYGLICIWIWIWGFPEMGGPPNHPFLDGIFPELNHLAIGVPPWLWNPPYRDRYGLGYGWWKYMLHWCNWGAPPSWLDRRTLPPGTQVPSYPGTAPISERIHPTEKRSPSAPHQISIYNEFILIYNIYINLSRKILNITVSQQLT